MAFVVDTEALAPYVADSFEHVAEALREAMATYVSVVFGMPRKAAVVATYADHVVTVVEGLGVYRVPYGRRPDGQVLFGDAETLPVAVVDTNAPAAYIEGESRKIAACLREGDREGVVQRSLALMPLLRPQTSQVEESFAPAWRHLYAKGGGADLVEGTPTIGGTLPPEEKLPGVRIAVRNHLVQARELVQSLRDRYGLLRDSLLCEGGEIRTEKLTTRELMALAESLHDEVFRLAARGTAIERRGANMQEMVAFVDEVSTMAPVYRTVIEGCLAASR